MSSAAALETLSKLREELDRVIKAEIVRLRAERNFLEIVLANTTEVGVQNKFRDVSIMDRVENLIGITRETK